MFALGHMLGRVMGLAHSSHIDGGDLLFAEMLSDGVGTLLYYSLSFNKILRQSLTFTTVLVLRF